MTEKSCDSKFLRAREVQKLMYERLFFAFSSFSFYSLGLLVLLLSVVLDFASFSLFLGLSFLSLNLVFKRELKRPKILKKNEKYTHYSPVQTVLFNKHLIPLFLNCKFTRKHHYPFVQIFINGSETVFLQSVVFF